MDNHDDEESVGGLVEALDIDSDYIRLPSEIAERIKNVQGQVEGKEYELARDNILSLMKLGGEALSDISSLALQSSHPRMFEVFNELMKTMITANRELMEIKKIDSKEKSDSEQNGKVINPDGSTTNVMINYTPAQMIEMMKKARESKE